MILEGAKETLTNRIVFGYTLVLSLILGAFIGYLSSVEQVFHDIYHAGDRFPLYFAMMALSLGFASFLNGKLVLRYGTRNLGKKAMKLMIFLSFLFLPIGYIYDGTPSLWLSMIYFMATFFSVGMLFGNLNAMAMEPLGHIAGIGAAIIGSVSTLLSVPIGVFIGQMYNGTLYPLILGFLFVGILSLALMGFVEKFRV